MTSLSTTREQHGRCDHPIEHLPKFSLMKKHECPHSRSASREEPRRRFFPSQTMLTSFSAASSLVDMVQEARTRARRAGILSQRFRQMRSYRDEDSILTYRVCLWRPWQQRKAVVAGTDGGDLKVNLYGMQIKQSIAPIPAQQLTALSIRTSSSWRQSLRIERQRYGTCACPVIMGPRAC